MQRFLCFLCGFAEVMAIGTAITLNLSRVVTVILVVIPVVLLALVLMVASWQRAAQERREQVYIYVPVDQRDYPGQATRLYQPGAMNGYEPDGRMW